MGLDMYLSARRYMSNHFHDGDDVKQRAIQNLFPELEGLKGHFGDYSPVNEVKVEVGYWRKANAIHEWFVKNVQGGEDECRPHRVSYEKLVELKEICEEVLEDPNKSQRLLPTASGFFFGSTEYDDWYLDNIRHTLSICNRCLDLPKGWDFEYCSSW